MRRVRIVERPNALLTAIIVTAILFISTRRHRVASRREIRARDEFALETARLETAVCLGDLVERDPLGHARPDGASCQYAEEPLQVFPGTTRDVAVM
jgi:hypothetical protein